MKRRILSMFAGLVILLTGFFAIGSDAFAYTISVTASPSEKTVAVGTSTTFSISGAYNGTPPSGSEETPENIRWQYAGGTAYSDANCTNVASGVSIPGADSSWTKNPSYSKTVTVGNSQAGTYWIKFQVKYRFNDTDSGTVATSNVVKLVVKTVTIDHLEYRIGSTGDFTPVTGTVYALKGATVTFKAIIDPPGATWPNGTPTWSGTAGASGIGETKSVTFNTLSTSASDTKTVIATCGTSSKTANVIVYGIDKIEYQNSAGQYVSAPSTMYVAAGATVNYRATVKPSPPMSWQAGEPVWSGTSGITGSGASKSVTFSATPSSSTSDTKTVIATGGGSETVNVVIVGINELQYKIGTGSFTPVTGTIYVKANTTVGFKAVIQPTGASWPEGQWPKWEGAPSGSDGKDTIDVPVGAASTTGTDYKTISALCGVSKKTANIIRMKLASIKVSSGSISATNPTDSEVCFATVPDGTVTVSIQAVCQPNIPEAYAQTYWRVTGGTPASGKFTTNPASTQLTAPASGTGCEYKVEAGMAETASATTFSTADLTTEVKLLWVTITPENAGGAAGAVPLTECMEEREITYTAKTPSWTSYSENIKYEFFFKKADGTEWTQVKNVKSSTAQTTNVVADQVANSPGASPNHHYFDTDVYVKATYKGATATSNTLNIRVYRLWIKHFKDHNSTSTYPSSTDWMVCVGRNIDYEAIASNDCNNWAWDLKSGTFYDYWQTTGGTSKAGTGMVIPTSELEDARGNHFGDIYGNVRVQCKDGDGNNHAFESIKMSQKAKVFFPRNQMLTGGACPAWFKFWAKDQGGPGVHKFDSTEVIHNVRITWEYNNSISGNGLCSYSYNPLTGGYATISMSSGVVGARNWTFSSPAYPAPPLVTFTNSAGVATSFPAGKISLSFVKSDYQSIDCAIKTARHELQHAYRFQNKYGGSINDNDTDRLPNSFEDSFGTNFNNSTTYSSFYLSGMDDEIDAEYEAQNPMPNAAAGMDWAYPGKQWY